NDSVSGHGIIEFAPGTTYEFRVSAHAISSSSSFATGNMYVEAVTSDSTGTSSIQIWADVYCTSVLALAGEVRGHIYRTDPDLLTEPTDLVFDVVDDSPATTSPDLFTATTETSPTDCVSPPPAFGEPLQKGEITVNDESPI